MKIICQKAELMKSINIVSKAVPSKTTMDILYCILIDATVDQIKFTANDMELGIETIVQGTIEERGLICLDAKMFGEIVRKLPDSAVTITTDDRLQTVISCESAVFRISGRDGLEFSPLPSIEKGEPVELTEFSLRELIRQTIFSISASDSNKILTGECLQIRDNDLRLIALDGHRVAIRSLTLTEPSADREVIIPGKSMNELFKILSGETKDIVRLYFTQGNILFELTDTIIVTRLIEGKYFRIDQMISNDFSTRVTVNKQELISALDRALLFTSESDKRPLVLNITDAEMGMRIQSALGSMDDSIAIAKSGKDLMIGFNPKFMLDALRVIDDEEVSLYFQNAKAPCFIRDEQQSYIYLVLPVNFVS